MTDEDRKLVEALESYMEQDAEFPMDRWALDECWAIACDHARMAGARIRVLCADVTRLRGALEYLARRAELGAGPTRSDDDDGTAMSLAALRDYARAVLAE